MHVVSLTCPSQKSELELSLLLFPNGSEGTYLSLFTSDISL